MKTTNKHHNPISNRMKGKDSQNQFNKESFLDSIDQLAEKGKPISHEKLLDLLLDKIEPIDFYEEVKANDSTVKGDFKLQKKHYLVITIDILIKIAQRNNFGLCKKYGSTYLYNGAYWKVMEKEGFESFLGKAAEKMDIDRYTARYYKFKEDLWKQFLSAGYLERPDTDDNSVLVNLQNGTFLINETETVLLNFNADDFLTYQLSFHYSPEAKAPLFQKYLDRVLPEKDAQIVLAEYLGYIFIKHGNSKLKLEKALLLYGSGANGKSVFYEIVMALLGRENISSFTLDQLTDKEGLKRAQIADKLLNYASEIGTGMATDYFKRLTSGEPVDARRLYGDPFDIYQYAKLMFNCNELPRQTENTNAFFRRFLIIHFNQTIPEEEQDKELPNKIIDNELSGVFNWALEGLQRLLRQGKFSYCRSSEAILNEFRTESNSVELFFREENYQKDNEAHIYIRDIYPEYRQFCIEDGLHPYSNRRFTKHLRQNGYKVFRATGNKTAVALSKNEDSETEEDFDDILMREDDDLPF